MYKTIFYVSSSIFIQNWFKRIYSLNLLIVLVIMSENASKFSIYSQEIYISNWLSLHTYHVLLFAIALFSLNVRCSITTSLLICCLDDLLLRTYRVIAFQPRHLCRSIISFVTVEAYRRVINEYRLPLHSFLLPRCENIRSRKCQWFQYDLESQVYYQDYFY